ncbi:MAG: hypothetical protein FWG47_03920 [Propionibacteriaceae bacterium]|nr:hypothetical protein [Propionibacteriaceae bacterium]
MSFYGLLWRVLPGSPAVKVGLLAVLAAIVVYVLFAWVFPAIADFMPFNNVTISD